MRDCIPLDTALRQWRKTKATFRWKSEETQERSERIKGSCRKCWTRWLDVFKPLRIIVTSSTNTKIIIWVISVIDRMCTNTKSIYLILLPDLLSSGRDERQTWPIMISRGKHPRRKVTGRLNRHHILILRSRRNKRVSERTELVLTLAQSKTSGAIWPATRSWDVSELSV